MTLPNSPSRNHGVVRRRLSGALAAVGLVLATYWPQSASAQVVDLALVLAVDVSNSVDAEEYRLQMQGIADAFRDPTIVEAITVYAPDGIAVSLVHWAGSGQQAQAVRWYHVRDPSSAEALAMQIERAPPAVPRGPTAVADALFFSMNLLETSGYLGRRKVVDISGDGRRNEGMWPAFVRNSLVERGITINALPILNEEPFLDRYYRVEVIGGPGAFVIPAADYVDFARAIRIKLLREIKGAPVAQVR